MAYAGFIGSGPVPTDMQKEVEIIQGPPAAEPPLVLEDMLITRARSQVHLDGSLEFSIRDLAVQRSNARVGQRISSLPTSLAHQEWSIENATGFEQSKDFTIDLETTEETEVKLSRTVESSTELKAEVKFGDVGGASASRSWTVTLGQERNARHTDTRKYSEEFHQRVPAHTAIRIDISREILNEVYALSGPIVLNGTLVVVRTVKDTYACGPLGTGRCSRTKTQRFEYPLNQLLSEADRTIELSGQMTLSSSANTRTVTRFTEYPLPGGNTGATSSPAGITP
jgi:hypothetical protein